jgi:hypothetical protein
MRPCMRFSCFPASPDPDVTTAGRPQSPTPCPGLDEDDDVWAAKRGSACRARKENSDHDRDGEGKYAVGAHWGGATVPTLRQSLQMIESRIQAHRPQHIESSG